MSETVAGAEYVAGFMFSPAESTVLLIRKTRPAWQAGKLNGVGGRIEIGESPEQAMRREFQEEVGIDCDQWRPYCTLGDERGWKIHFLFATGPISSAAIMTDEQPYIAFVNNLPDDVISNLKWLIPMALSMKHERTASFEIKEVS